MKASLVAVGLLAIAGMTVGTAMAQQDQNPSMQQQQRGQLDQSSNNQQSRSSLSDQNRAHKNVVRASDVIGIDVQNDKGEDLGTIEDLVLDTRNGQIKYAAVSMGGFLGMGDKLFAVPFKTLECRHGQDAQDETVAILHVDKENLKNAQGFDQSNWPDMANERWQQQNDRNFQSTSANQRQTDRDVN